ncbi:hypothetical protein [Wolbachia endosymbiont of Tribolium confusum]|uniref:hypothetical protein n=1 Tax=Wolbachia endosymbiont of Tribolium confusum TaxID=214474 RepID=UPI001CF33B7D|nr:hypothetical protein [Wolbachia endosymbiont of Tribolium confusum]MCA7010917.1 hypothetical protein [Wolbachia endosymbiont of Tribolium confusum]
MDFDKAGNSKDLNNEKLQLICKAYNRRLLSNQRVVDGINSMDDSKLKILCKYHNKFSHKGIEELLSDESIVNHINDYDDEMFRSMLNDATSEHNILEILKGGEICNTNNEFESSDSEEDKDLSDFFDCEESDSEEDKDLSDFFDCKESDSEEGEVKEDILKLQQEDPEIAKNLSFIDNQTLKVICKKFSPSDIKALLENQAVVVNITDYNNKELKHVFNICGSLAIQNIIKVLSINPKKLRLICNKCNFSDTRTLLENQNLVEGIDSLTLWKLELICNNKKFSSSDIKTLLENQEIVKRIGSSTSRESELIFGKFSLQDIIKVLENIAPEKSELIFERFSPSNTQTLLENQKIVYNISGYKTEELHLLFYSYELSPQSIIKALENITPEKLRLICNKSSPSNTQTLLENQEVVNGIGFTPLEELESMCSHSSLSDIIKLLKDKNGPSSVLSEARKEEASSCTHDMA